MKIKVPNIEFISFSDGVCSIYSEDEEGNRTYKFINLGFSKRVLGSKRYYAAAAAQVEINAVMRIPKVPGIDNHDNLEIKNTGRYDIELAQEIFDSNPPCIELTLKQLEMLR